VELQNKATHSLRCRPRTGRRLAPRLGRHIIHGTPRLGLDLDQERRELERGAMSANEGSWSAADVLASCAFFSGLDAHSRQRLVRMAQRRDFRKGEVIFREGDPVPGLYVVGDGMVRIYKLAPSGKEHVLHLAGPGMTFAEVAVLANFACPATAEAIEPTGCVLLPAQAFTRALREDHGLCLQLLSSLGLWVRSLVSLLEGVVLRDAAGRVAAYLLQAQPEHGTTVALPGLKKHVASHLNLTSETLSRVLRQLREDRLISETDAGLRIDDRKALQQLAEGFYPRL
jgi:CRP/FNR family transcriptional regulator